MKTTWKIHERRKIEIDLNMRKNDKLRRKKKEWRSMKNDYETNTHKWQINKENLNERNTNWYKDIIKRECPEREMRKWIKIRMIENNILDWEKKSMGDWGKKYEESIGKIMMTHEKIIELNRKMKKKKDNKI